MYETHLAGLSYQYDSVKYGPLVFDLVFVFESLE